MAVIKLLDTDTINQIAAGEVVDRPSSIVKELLENSIDAGASLITVEIKDGGVSFIRITDNGCGIDKEDISMAFLRHCTSKIKGAEDLLTVKSLGFRGEALSSIAAVAQVELITKTKNSLNGIRYVIEGGEEKQMEEIGAPDGTTLIIRSLFYNTPARRKFLKTAATEGGYVGNIAEQIALSHPEVSIRFINNGQNRLYTPGNDKIRDVIYHVYGREITENLIEIQGENDFLKVEGYIGKPVISRGNRNFENYFINGRYIKNNVIAKAVEEAYKPYMMQHKYPFTALQITIDPALCDVNVHPSKMEVRFRNQEEVYRILYRTISDALSGRELIPSVQLPERDSVQQDIPKEHRFIKQEHSQKAPAKTNNLQGHIEPFEVKRMEAAREQEESARLKPSFVREKQSVYEAKPVQMSLFEEPLLSQQAKSSHRIIGQLFDTYWLIEYRESLYIIDQHAAHEKVLYERTMKQLKEKQVFSQNLEPPIILSLTAKEENVLNTCLPFITRLGYNIEHFGGNEYAVRAVPDHLFSLCKKELLLQMLDEMGEETTGISENSLIMAKVASMSCKAAVKGNMHLSVREAEELIGELLTLDNPYHCPHGRPTIISMTKYELEKKFKRII